MVFGCLSDRQRRQDFERLLLVGRGGQARGFALSSSDVLEHANDAQDEVHFSEGSGFVAVIEVGNREEDEASGIAVSFRLRL